MTAKWTRLMNINYNLKKSKLYGNLQGVILFNDYELIKNKFSNKKINSIRIKK